MRIENILGQGSLFAIFFNESLDRQECCAASVISFGLGAAAMEMDGHPYGETKKDGADKTETCDVCGTK